MLGLTALTPALAGVMGRLGVRAQPFSTTAAVLENKRKKKTRLVRKTNMEKRTKLREAAAAGRPDPVLGYPTGRGTTDLWEPSFLNSLILKKDEVWQNGGVGFNFGLRPQDVDELLSAVPRVAAATAVAGASDVTEMAERAAAAEAAEDAKADRLRRILDLRNASSQGIQAENRRRIIKAFQRHSKDTASPEVQAALLTFRIRTILQHLVELPKDIHSQHPLRKLVHERIKVLKYLRKTDETRYQDCLAKIGIEARAVESEVSVSSQDMKRLIRPL